MIANDDSLMTYLVTPLTLDGFIRIIYIWLGIERSFAHLCNYKYYFNSNRGDSEGVTSRKRIKNVTELFLTWTNFHVQFSKRINSIFRRGLIWPAPELLPYWRDPIYSHHVDNLKLTKFQRQSNIFRFPPFKRGRACGLFVVFPVRLLLLSNYNRRQFLVQFCRKKS